ncbi:MAG: polysaccharide ABC transporter ATP-binding protein [Puniceicoccaceae bacterium]
MPDPIIDIQNLSKCYRLGEIGATSLREETSRLLRRLRGREQSESKQDFWALQDINIQIMPGEVVGIIGKNGAGKSTLLKLISRITEPTGGEIRLRGRIAALLEVGTGFHPELTGRENIYLNGTILGMRKIEIDRKLDEIIAFSGIERHIDTPIKRYSSGMNVRLGFAVAAHLEPEILIVDEVLAVGDLDFQKKCIEKMDSVSRHGRTVLFVSHNMATISQLCPRSILLEQGRVKCSGPTEEVIRRYRSRQKSEIGESYHSEQFMDLRVTTADGELHPQVEADTSIQIRFRLAPAVLQARLKSITFGINNAQGDRIFTVGTDINPCTVEIGSASGELCCEIPHLSLPPGDYFLKPMLHTIQKGWIVEDDIPVFEVVPSDFFGSGKMTHPGLGRVLKQANWSHSPAL